MAAIDYLFLLEQIWLPWGLVLIYIKVCISEEFKYNLKYKKKGFEDQKDETVILVFVFHPGKLFFF